MMNDINNYWTNLSCNREIFNNIDEKVVDVWVDDKTVGDLILSLNKEELELFYKLKIVDCGLEKTNSVIDLSIKLPDFEGY